MLIFINSVFIWFVGIKLTMKIEENILFPGCILYFIVEAFLLFSSFFMISFFKQFHFNLTPILSAKSIREVYCLIREAKRKKRQHRYLIYFHSEI